jgi:hypothetical protein
MDGDVRRDYEDQEIDIFIDDLVYDDEMDPSDPRWARPPGMEVHSYLRQQLAPWVVFFPFHYHRHNSISDMQTMRDYKM